MRNPFMKMFSVIVIAPFIVSTNIALAATYPAPAANESLIGRVDYTYISGRDTVSTVSKRYDVGFNALEEANPQIDITKKISGQIKLPTQHLLPNQPREGIVVNLPEMRMYYFIPGTNQVATYPIGIGKIGKTIPIQEAVVTKKVKDPVWVPPDDIREFNLAQGIVLPQVMPAGPDNPLGPYAIYMSIPTFLFHSTIFPESIGKRASFGCVRMYESDMQNFFPSVTKGIRVTIINSPIKVSWQDNKLYMEAHPSLEEHHGAFTATLPGTVSQIRQLARPQDVLIDWQGIAFIENERDGSPHEIGIRIG